MKKTEDEENIKLDEIDHEEEEVDETDIIDEPEEMDELETPIEKEKTVLVHKQVKLVSVIIGILLFVAAFAGAYLMSREGIVGLLRLILIPIVLGAFGYAVLYLIFNFLAGRIKKGHRTLYILLEIAQYAVIIFIGYSILNPVKDLVHGAEPLEVNIVSKTLSSNEAGIKLSSSGNGWIDSKYHMTITKYGKFGAEDEIYEFPVDLDTYNYFRDHQDSLYFEMEYYKNTNTLKSCSDVTDEVLNEMFGTFLNENETE